MTFKVFRHLFKAITLSLFNLGDSSLKRAGKELISKKTFRLPDDASYDRLIGVRQFKRIWFQLESGLRKDHTNEDILLFDSSSQSIQLRKEYLIWFKNYDNTKIAGYSRSDFYRRTSVVKTKLTLILLAFFVIPISVFSKNRVQWSLLFNELVEISGLLHLVDSNDFKRLHFFSVAEKDANFAYLMVSCFSIEVVKHPSPGALIAHNEYLMTDVLALSSNYQNDEYQLKLKETISTKGIEKWLPENAREYHHLYKDPRVQDDFSYKIGFYSHGGWLRLKKKATNALFAKPSEEIEVLEILSGFFKNATDERMIIYLHPKEKKHFDEALQFYAQYFDLNRVDFYRGAKSSSSHFKEAEYGVGSYSTVLFERDNYKFKTLVYRDESALFPIIGSAMFLNSFNSLEEFEKIVK